MIDAETLFLNRRLSFRGYFGFAGEALVLGAAEKRSAAGRKAIPHGLESLRENYRLQIESRRRVRHSGSRRNRRGAPRQNVPGPKTTGRRPISANLY